MKRISIELVGVTPLLQHRMTEDELYGLLGAKTKQKKDKEVLTPREIADKYVYRNSTGKFFIPAEYVTGAVAAVASDYKQSNSAKRSLKAVARSVFRPEMGEILLLGEDDKPLPDYEVDVRKATNHKVGAVAVCRPRFDKWKVKFEATISDDLVSVETMQQILEDSGRRSGIGSFRVAKGGIFGQYRVTKFQQL